MDYHRLFTFDHWANREIARALGGAQGPEEAIRLFGHIVAAEWLWLRRLGREGRELRVWPELTLAECERELAPLREAWLSLLGEGDGLAAGTIFYTNSKGEAWASGVEDVLTHVIAHGVHHRGQIAALFRREGLEPPYVDFIEAARRGFLDAADRPV
jgi:uncharacterized damage-inducible protein DinB